MLVSGALRVRKGDVQVNTITHPGALIGEMSVLLGTGTARPSRPPSEAFCATPPTATRCWPAIQQSPSSSPSAWPSG